MRIWLRRMLDAHDRGYRRRLRAYASCSMFLQSPQIALHQLYTHSLALRSCIHLMHTCCARTPTPIPTPTPTPAPTHKHTQCTPAQPLGHKPTNSPASKEKREHSRWHISTAGSNRRLQGDSPLQSNVGRSAAEKVHHRFDKLLADSLHHRQGVRRRDQLLRDLVVRPVGHVLKVLTVLNGDEGVQGAPHQQHRHLRFAELREGAAEAAEGEVPDRRAERRMEPRILLQLLVHKVELCLPRLFIVSKGLSHPRPKRRRAEVPHHAIIEAQRVAHERHQGPAHRQALRVDEHDAASLIRVLGNEVNSHRAAHSMADPHHIHVVEGDMLQQLLHLLHIHPWREVQLVVGALRLELPGT
mmetsp:Transcript_14036/g.52573  ORF Transcript_14036/g.52573 Transcript_14036/m.52573 type:complete len:356 (-) Transcript_14036:79-1146(-)